MITLYSAQATAYNMTHVGTPEISESSCVDTESDSHKFWISSSVGDEKEKSSFVEFSKSLIEDVDSRKLLDNSKGLFSSEWIYQLEPP